MTSRSPSLGSSTRACSPARRTLLASSMSASTRPNQSVMVLSFHSSDLVCSPTGENQFVNVLRVLPVLEPVLGTHYQARADGSLELVGYYCVSIAVETFAELSCTLAQVHLEFSVVVHLDLDKAFCERCIHLVATDVLPIGSIAPSIRGSKANEVLVSLYLGLLGSVNGHAAIGQ